MIVNSCIVMCPCCGTILQVTSNVLGSNAYPFHSNIQMSLRDMVQSNQIAQPNYAQMCCAISQEENKNV
jgi:hypothetical protein